MIGSYGIYHTARGPTAHIPCTLHDFCHCSMLALEHAKSHTLMYFYDLTTLTYTELEHAQSKYVAHGAMADLDVVNRRGRTKAQFVAFVALIKSFEAKIRIFFVIFDIMIELDTC